MQEERSGSGQQPPEYQSAWPASPEGSDGSVGSPGGDADQARHADDSPAPGEQAAPGAPADAGAAAGADPLQTAHSDIPRAGKQPGAGQPAAGGYEYPAMIYAPPGSYPAGAGGPGAPGGYGPPGGGYEAGGYGPGYGPGGPGYQADYGYGPGYQADYGYGPGGYEASGYGPGGYGPGGYGPGGYGPGGYGPGGSGYGMPGDYGSDDVIGGYGQPRPPRRGARILTYVLVAALAAGVGAGTVLALNHTAGSASSSAPAQPGLGLGPLPGIGSGGGGSGQPASSTTKAVVKKVSPGIVDIISQPGYQPGKLEGTGMVISSDGLVLTNNHVVEGTSSWTVKIADTGRTYTSVTVLGTDAKDDVALLKLNNASNLSTIPRGSSSSVRVGDPVVALGNAGGADGKPSVVTGQITGLNKSITATDQGAGTTESLHGMLVTNAPIISGDSGGALANTQGQVIGMNTAANSTSDLPNISGGQGTSMGFAIPINRALAIAAEIASRNTSANHNIQVGLPAFLGVTVASGSSGPSTFPSPSKQLQQLQNAASQQNFGVPAVPGSGSGGCLTINAEASIPSHIAPVSSGTLISGVLCNTPVSAVGMTAGSVITGISGQTVTSPSTLTQVLTHFHPGEVASVHWVSPNGQQHTSSLRLASGPAK